MFLQFTHEAGYILSILKEKINIIEKDEQTGKGLIYLDNKQLIPVNETYEEVLAIINAAV